MTPRTHPIDRCDPSDLRDVDAGRVDKHHAVPKQVTSLLRPVDVDHSRLVELLLVEGVTQLRHRLDGREKDMVTDWKHDELVAHTQGVVLVHDVLLVHKVLVAKWRRESLLYCESSRTDFNTQNKNTENMHH